MAEPAYVIGNPEISVNDFRKPHTPTPLAGIEPRPVACQADVVTTTPPAPLTSGQDLVGDEEAGLRVGVVGSEVDPEGVGWNHRLPLRLQVSVQRQQLAVGGAGVQPDAHGHVVVDVGAEVVDSQADDALGGRHDVPGALLRPLKRSYVFEAVYLCNTLDLEVGLCV